MEANLISAIAQMIVSKFVAIKNSTFIGVRGYLNEAKELANYVLIADFSWGEAVEKTIGILNSLTETDFTAMAEQSGCCNVSGNVYSNKKEGKLYLETGKIPKEGTKAREDVLKSIRTTKTLAEYRDEWVQQLRDNIDPDKEKHSNQSIAQSEAYERVYFNGKLVPSVKVHRFNKDAEGKPMVHIWAMAHSKDVKIKGEYKDKEQTLEGKQKTAIEKYCKYVLKDAEGKPKELPITKYRNLIVSASQMAEVRALGDTIVVAE
jgi:hypothetical protein